MHNKDKFFDKEQILEEVLKTEPRFSLSDNFAYNLAKIAEKKNSLGKLLA